MAGSCHSQAPSSTTELLTFTNRRDEQTGGPGPATVIADWASTPMRAWIAFHHPSGHRDPILVERRQNQGRVGWPCGFMVHAILGTDERVLSIGGFKTGICYCCPPGS